MRYPKPLEKNGVIGLIAPSFGAATEPYITGLSEAEKAWEKLGYRPYEYGCARKAEGIGISAAPETCAQEVNEAMSDETSDVLISVGGGELMCEVMSYVDFDLLKRSDPKWFLGYSDNTNLGFLLATLCDTASIYGPCAAAFGMDTWHENLYDCFKILTGEYEKSSQESADEACFRLNSYGFWEAESLRDEFNPTLPYNTTEPLSLRCYESRAQSVELDGPYADETKTVMWEKLGVHMEGRVLVGCLDVLAGLIGTRFDKVREFCQTYCDDGIIWALESCELSPIQVRRVLWQMSEAGWFQGAKGFIFGRPYLYEEEEFGLNQKDAVLTALANAGIDCPVILDADLGHLPPAMPIVCGSYISVDADQDELSLLTRLI